MPTRPWYRHFWVWALFVPPVASIVFWAVVITTMAGPPSLVVDDYAQIGLTYEQERERDAAAAKLGVRARLHLARKEGVVTVVLLGLEPLPEQLVLRLSHPAEAARDHNIRLSRDAGGIYRGRLLAGADGRWRVELTPPDGTWRLGDLLFAGESGLELDPPRQLAEQ